MYLILFALIFSAMINLLMLYVNTPWQSANIVKVCWAAWSCEVIGHVVCVPSVKDEAQDMIKPNSQFYFMAYLLSLLSFKEYQWPRFIRQLFAFALSVDGPSPFLDSQCLWNASCNIKFL